MDALCKSGIVWINKYKSPVSKLHGSSGTAESKSNNKTPKNPFNFDSIKNFFRVHTDTGIRMLFKFFLQKVIE